MGTLAFDPATGHAVLIVEDDVDLAGEIRETLEAYGFSAAVATSWPDALDALSVHHPELILLDQRLGTVDTVPLLPVLRARTNATIIILTGNRQEVDRIVALEIGADDFLQKPITGRELVARLRAHLRRRMSEAGASAPQPAAGRWLFDAQTRRLRRPDGSEVDLTAAEFDLLAALVDAAGEPLSRDDLTRQVLGRPWRPDDRALDNLVLHLRQKLGAGGARSIVTIRNRGYAFTTFPEE